jgi:hypothetical protein
MVPVWCRRVGIDGGWESGERDGPGEQGVHRSSIGQSIALVVQVDIRRKRFEYTIRKTFLSMRVGKGGGVAKRGVTEE